MSPAPAPVRRRLPGLVLWLLLLVLLGTAGFGGWRAWQFRAELLEALEAQERLMHRMSRQLASVQAETEGLTSRQDELGQAHQRLGVDLADLGSRLEESEQTMARLTNTVQGGRTRLQVLAVEQLLLAANDRLQLARDIAGAQKALELAEARLAVLSEPRLFRVREAISQERAALAALPRADVSSVALALNSLIQRVDALPLAARPPEHFEVKSAPADTPADAQWPQRLWAKIRTALTQVFTVRRKDERLVQLLPAEQEAIVRQILSLRLESARFAALRGEHNAYRGALTAAAEWLKRYFKHEDAAVLATQAELERLAALELAPAPPDISRSLALLRAYVEASPR